MNLDIRKQTELTLLRSVIDNPERMTMLLDYDEDLFHFEKHKAMFRIFDECEQNNVAIDPPTLLSKMTQNGFTEKEAVEYQLMFARIYPTLNIYELIHDLIKQNNVDRVYNMAVDLKNGIEKNAIKYDDMIELIGDAYEDINATFLDDKDIHIQEINKTPMEDLFKPSNFIKLGIRELDEMIIGLFNGQIITIAARPGLGKSTLAMQIAQHQEGATYFLSREMPVRKLYARNLSHYAEVESWKIEFAKCQEEEIKQVLHARRVIEENKLNIFYNDKIKDYRKIIRRTKRIKDLKLIILDYLQLMKGSKAATRERYIADMTGDLKDYAKERDIPIIILSQLNRAMEYDDREPVLADLRESGAIEQDSDVVVFIHCKKSQEIGIEDKYYFIVAKNRDGKVGKIETDFQKKFYKFGRKTSHRSDTDWINN